MPNDDNGLFQARDIARYVINRCLSQDIEITNLKLQHLLYFVQGEYSRITGKRLFEDNFYAWHIGVIVPAIYHSNTVFASTPLSEQPFMFMDHETANIIDSILQEYAHYDTWTLVEKAKEQDPWKYNYEIFGYESIISYKCIYDYFQEKERTSDE